MAKQKGFGLGAAILGVAVGATAAVFASKKNRQVIGKKITQVKNQGEKSINKALKKSSKKPTKSKKK